MTVLRNSLGVPAVAVWCVVAAIGLAEASAGVADVGLADQAASSIAAANPVPPSSLLLGGGCSEHYSIGYGEPVSAYMPPRDQFCYGFEGAAGDVITIRMTRVDGDLDSFVDLWGPQSEIARDDDSGGDLNSLIEDVHLTEAGHYEILVSGVGDTSGTFELSLTRDPGCGSIGYDQPVSEYIQPGDVYCYGFTAAAGDMVTARMTSLDFILDPYLELWGEEGVLIADDDGGGSRNSLIDQYTLPADGFYRLLAKGYGDSAGPFELVLSRAEEAAAPCTECGAAIAVWTPVPTPGPCTDPEGCRRPFEATPVILNGAVVYPCNSWTPAMCTSFGVSGSSATFTPGTAVCLVWSESGSPKSYQNLTLTVRQWSSADGRNIDLVRTNAMGMGHCIRTQLPTTAGVGQYKTTIRLEGRLYMLQWRLAR